ncbi:FecR family protein [Pedobacter heparinus]|uniref:FecR family protein n=1 Tax=Pedobacter heparinus TaxID=984 RepID=UPI00292F8EE7|nr:FecR domain-containing protein [Pedobacter heparinus]
MNKESINALVEKYLNGTSSEEETVWVEKWLDERSKKSGWDWRDERHQKEVQKEIFKRIDDELSGFRPLKRNRFLPVYLLTAAAVLLIGLVVGLWFLPGQKANQELSYATGKPVKPGTKAATLQLGNGEVIYLDDKATGVLNHSDDVRISKMAGGIIQYNALKSISSDKIVENTLSIPRGGQYQITLSDGTNVWLNSETKLIYPNRFTGKERRVKVVGEAYFDVAKNVDHPFIVGIEGMDIRVTGTEFNVSAYKVFETATTLIEGSVEIHSQRKLKMKLSPGQQAYQMAGKPEIGKRLVDVNTVISWKKGYFSFDYLSLEEVMNEISRWYDIDYKIVGKATKQEKLGGTFSREKSIDELLTYIEQLVDVKIVRKERSVTIMY